MPTSGLITKIFFMFPSLPELLDEVCFRGSEADEAAEVEVR